MRLFVLVSAILFGCLRYADLREYHYSQPQTPFYTGVASQPQQPQAQPQIAPQYQTPSVDLSAILRSFGPSGTATVARQQSPPPPLPPPAPAPVPQQASSIYLPPHAAAPQYQTSQYSNNQGNVGGGGYASSVAASYQPQQQQQYATQQHYQTPNANPLTQYQQPTGGYANAAQVQQFVPNYSNSQQQFAAGSYNGQAGYAGQAGQYAQAGQAGQYGQAGQAGQFGQAGQAGQFGQAGQVDQFGQAGLAGQPSQFAGQSGKELLAAAGPGHTVPLDGNYISQSEIGELHDYEHQQVPIGDTRPFARQVSDCSSSGQCQQQKNLKAGEYNPSHQQNVAAAHYKVEHVSEKCFRLAQALRGEALASGSIDPNDPTYSGGSVDTNSISIAEPVRPVNRRYYPYAEEILPHDPYN